MLCTRRRSTGRTVSVSPCPQACPEEELSVPHEVRFTKKNTMMNDDKYPEQDPAEGSRETTERDLRRQDQVRSHSGKEPRSDIVPGSEAAEPSPA